MKKRDKEEYIKDEGSDDLKFKKGRRKIDRRQEWFMKIPPASKADTYHTTVYTTHHNTNWKLSLRYREWVAATREGNSA